MSNENPVAPLALSSLTLVLLIAGCGGEPNVDASFRRDDGQMTVFTTSRALTADLIAEAGTLTSQCADLATAQEAADCICQYHAVEASIHTGPFSAWLGVTGDNVCPFVGGQSYWRADDTLVVDLEGLPGCPSAVLPFYDPPPLDASVDVDEKGRPSLGSAWGVSMNWSVFQVPEVTCEGYTTIVDPAVPAGTTLTTGGLFIDVTSTDPFTSDGEVQECRGRLPLLCIEQPR